MTGKTHVMVGTTAGLAIVMLNPLGFELDGVRILPVLGLITASAGSYLPDIDIPQSKLGQRHKIISKMLTHRGFTHTLVIPAIFTILMKINVVYLSNLGALLTLLNSLLYGLLLGWVLHIFADLWNYKGVPILFPITRHKFHIASVKTRHWTENVWLFLYICCVIFYVYTKGGFS